MINKMFDKIRMINYEAKIKAENKVIDDLVMFTIDNFTKYKKRFPTYDEIFNLILNNSDKITREQIEKSLVRLANEIHLQDNKGNESQ